MTIIQIVPQLPPAIDGLGDYALNLGLQLQEDFGLQTIFVVGNSETKSERIEGFSVKPLSIHSAKALTSLLSELKPKSSIVLLHYVNYGYAKRGCPVWLVRGLKGWLAGNKNRQLVTMFHEVYASSSLPWTSSFWTSPVQKHLASQLSKLSEYCLTSKQLYAHFLEELNPSLGKQIPVIPVFSNIGEPQKVPPLIERTRRLVVFGGSGTRLRVYQKSLCFLTEICQQLDIKEIVDIGPATGLNLSDIQGVPVVVMGKQPASKISEIFLDSIVGFFYYPLDFLARSTIFAAYCSHGLIPVGSSYYAWGKENDGLVGGQHYWLADSQKTILNLPVGQSIANTAFDWYQSHRLSEQSKLFAQYLLSQGGNFDSQFRSQSPKKALSNF